MSNKSFLLLVSMVAFVFSLSGCSSIDSAYDSVSDTVSGWFKSDSKPAK
jgi:uncharacterized protein YceK